METSRKYLLHATAPWLRCHGCHWGLALKEQCQSLQGGAQHARQGESHEHGIGPGLATDHAQQESFHLGWSQATLGHNHKSAFPPMTHTIIKN